MTKAKTKWQNEYISRKYDRINLLVEHGDREKIREAAQKAGISLNAFIVQAINDKINKEVK